MATGKKSSGKSMRIMDDQHTIKSNVGQRADNKNQAVAAGIAKSKKDEESMLHKHIKIKGK